MNNLNRLLANLKKNQASRSPRKVRVSSPSTVQLLNALKMAPPFARSSKPQAKPSSSRSYPRINQSRVPAPSHANKCVQASFRVRTGRNGGRTVNLNELEPGIVYKIKFNNKSRKKPNKSIKK